MKRSLSFLKLPFFRTISFILGALFAGALVLSLAAKAVHTGSPDEFELGPTHDPENANIINDIGAFPIGPPDWAELFIVDGITGEVTVNDVAVTAFGGSEATFIQDQLSSNSLKGSEDLTGFDGTNKNNDPIMTKGDSSRDVWQWNTENHPPKDDLFNVYSYATIIDSDLIIYAALERITNNGASHIDFEYNQAGIALDKMPPCEDDLSAGLDDGPGCEFVGDKRQNDLLVVMDFERGGDLGFVEIRKWETYGTPSNADDEYVLVAGGVLNGEGCNGADTVCAYNNHAPIDGGPWENRGKNGAIVTELEENTFTEVGINVTELLQASPCFNSLNAKSRTSPSFNSELKDFALGKFELCKATVETDVHDNSHGSILNQTVKVGTLAHDFAEVQGEGLPVALLPEPTGTVTFTLYNNSACTAEGEGNMVIATWDADLDTGAAGDGMSTADMLTDGVNPNQYFDTLGLAGEYGFLATYSGDENYPAAELDICEPFAVEKYDSMTVTQVHDDAHTDVTNQTVDATSMIHDFAYVGLDPGETDPGILPAPTGDVTFQFFADASCGDEIDDATFPYTTALGALLGYDAAAETPDVELPVGGRSFLATYEGDDNYNGSAEEDCEPITGRKLPSSIVTHIHEGDPDAAHSTTDIQDTTVKVLTIIHDQAIVSGQAGAPVPTGTVDFALFDNLTCSGEPFSVQSGVVLDGSAEAESDMYQAVYGTTGQLAYKAIYSGDELYDPSPLSDCEPLSLEKYDSLTATQVHNGAHDDITGLSVPALSVVHDFARVSLAPSETDPGGLPAPTGDVTFKLFADASCGDEIDDATYPYTTLLGALLGYDAAAETPDFVMPVGGRSFRAMYLGDSVYESSVDSLCEPITGLKLDSSVVTHIHLDGDHVTDIQSLTEAIPAGSIVHDQAVVTGQLGAGLPTGYVDFARFDNLYCEGDPVNVESDVLLDGSAEAESSDFVTVAGEMAYKAVYKGDDLYNPSGLSDCEPLPVVGEFYSCTPGYWKQDQHFGSWVGYTTGQLYVTVFGITDTWLPGKYRDYTLLEALQAGGNSMNEALLRHSTAALLNAANDDVNYPLNVAGVIDLVYRAWDPTDDSVTPEEAHQILAGYNEEFDCPLGYDPGDI